MLGADVEENELLPLDGLQDLFDVGFQLPDAHLHDDLPERHHACKDVAVGIFDQVPRPLSKLLIVSQPPKKGMSVEEELQSSSFSMAVSTSGGSVSKSGAIRILPRRAPG